MVLKSTHAISGLRAKRRSRGLQRRLVDKGQTAAFKSFCDNLEGAKNGDKALQSQLVKISEANSRIPPTPSSSWRKIGVPLQALPRWRRACDRNQKSRRFTRNFPVHATHGFSTLTKRPRGVLGSSPACIEGKQAFRLLTITVLGIAGSDLHAYGTKGGV
jgi:hypothetical protein